jgi:predicted regulator of Ras-like GTPase activity (Roadblock/LC7/MglB family)
MLGWDDVEISLRAQCRLQDRAITSSLESVLLEAFRQLDEAAAGRESPEPAGRRGEQTPQGSKENVMALEQILEEFKGIKGYLAVGIMEYTGDLLAFHEAEKSVNLAVTGAVFNDIFRGAHEASTKAGLDACRQMTIATPKGLVVMECSGAQAAVHLHMITVLQADGNQALARMTMDKAIKAAKDSMS